MRRTRPHRSDRWDDQPIVFIVLGAAFIAVGLPVLVVGYSLLSQAIVLEGLFGWTLPLWGAALVGVGLLATLSLAALALRALRRRFKRAPPTRTV